MRSKSHNCYRQQFDSNESRASTRFSPASVIAGPSNAVALCGVERASRDDGPRQCGVLCRRSMHATQLRAVASIFRYLPGTTASRTASQSSANSGEDGLLMIHRRITSNPALHLTHSDGAGGVA